jgi:LuxR family maltose regulon positive regulatory protein
LVEQLASEYLIERPELSARLDAALSSPVTLLVAQAGAGKTVLLQQWTAAHPELAVAWIDVESADEDPAHFSRRLVSALADVRPEMMRMTRLSALSADGLGGALLQAVVEELASFPETVVVLDDLHHLSDPAMLDDLGRLVAAVPANVHIIISTRADPPIAWSRLRLRRRLLEIRQADLALSEAESANLLARVAGREVEPELLGVLVSRTEGWVAGLQLAGLTLKYHAHPLDFVAQFGGTDRLVAEYLTEEVLDALPKEGRSILLRMSPLETMTAALVDEVLGRSDAQHLFERLEEESLFLVAADSRREQFRFHQLFRDLLRYRLRAEDPEEERRILGRAADHHLARGELVPAVEYLLRARQWDRALEAIMTRGSDVFERGEMRTVIRWITSIPESARARRRDVALELGILLGMQGDVALCADILTRVANDPDATAGERLIAHAWLSATVQWGAHPEEAMRAADRALALLGSGTAAPIPELMHLTTPSLLETLTMGSLGRAYFLAGDPAAAEAHLLRALSSDGSAYPPFRVGILGSLALLHICGGRAVQAHLLASEAFEIAESSALLSHPVVADAYLAESLVAYERGAPEAAAAPLREGTVRAEANQRSQLAWIARWQRAQLALAEGRLDEALELVDLAQYDASSAPAPLILDGLVSVRLAVLRRAGQSEDALRYRGGARPTSADVAFETIAAHLALGRLEAARRLLSETSAAFEALRPRGIIQRAILRAWIAVLEGSRRAALDFVDEALDLAEPEGLMEIFVGSGPIVLDLVAELATRREGLAAAIVARSRDAQPGAANGRLPEPLTERELEILAYLPDHSTNGEIAARCFVSVNTLKTHTAHIYRKLGVSGRSAAVARARELGLLTPVSRAQLERA